MRIDANLVAGDTDPGTGELRKIRMADPARRRGKRSLKRIVDAIGDAWKQS